MEGYIWVGIYPSLPPTLPLYICQGVLIAITCWLTKRHHLWYLKIQRWRRAEGARSRDLEPQRLPVNRSRLHPIIFPNTVGHTHSQPGSGGGDAHCLLEARRLGDSSYCNVPVLRWLPHNGLAARRQPVAPSVCVEPQL